jgi:hypothetical protein
MKKFITVLAVLLVSATTLFAAPAGLVSSLDNFGPADGKSSIAAGAFGADAGSLKGDLFADVGALQLTDTEAQAVEGDGPFGLAVGGLLGGIGGMLIGKAHAVFTGGVFNINTAWTYGAVIGMSIGIWF